MAAGTELCPHCQRPFKRLRAHLPHCKARPPAPAPSPGPGRASGARPTPGSAPGSAPAATPEPSPGTAPGPRADPGSGRGAGSSRGSGPGSPRSRSRAVQDVARSLDLHPEEVEDVPKKLQKGVKVVIERHRARVLREEPRSRAGAAGSGREGTEEPGPAAPPQRHKTAQKSKSGEGTEEPGPAAPPQRHKTAQKSKSGEGTEPGPAAPPKRHKTAQKSKNGEGTEPGPAPHPAQKSKSKESRSQGAVGSGTGSAKGEKSALKAAKALEELPENRNGLGQQERRDKFTAGEELVHLEFGVGSEPPVAALHPQNLPVSLLEALGGHSQGTSRNELPQRLQDSREGVQGVPELVLNLGRAPGLALLHTPQIQPPCSAQTSGRSTRARGLEWVPDLYPDGEGLRIVPGERFQEDVRSVAETPRGGFTQGQRGPLWERPLLEVRLGELHSWISTCSFSPQGLLGAVQRAWNSYCAKYIHVKQGGPAGISMLLAGYCLLSYGWNYQHFKRHRWRKYH